MTLPPPAQAVLQTTPSSQPAFSTVPVAVVAGSWEGEISIGDEGNQTLPFSLHVDAHQEAFKRIFVRVGRLSSTHWHGDHPTGSPWTLLDDVSVDADGWLRGRCVGDLATADANRRPYWLHVELKRRDDDAGQRLCGCVTAISIDGHDEKVGNALSHWTTCRRVL